MQTKFNIGDEVYYSYYGEVCKSKIIKIAIYNNNEIFYTLGSGPSKPYEEKDLFAAFDEARNKYKQEKINILRGEIKEHEDKIKKLEAKIRELGK